jgi:hypothetical protein
VVVVVVVEVVVVVVVGGGGVRASRGMGGNLLRRCRSDGGRHHSRAHDEKGLCGVPGLQLKVARGGRGRGGTRGHHHRNIGKPVRTACATRNGGHA